MLLQYFKEKFFKAQYFVFAQIFVITHNEIHEQSLNLKQKTIEKINKDKKPQNLVIGSQVYKKLDKRAGKLKRRYSGPFILKQILENSKIEIQNPKNNRTEIIHINETKLVPIVPDGSESPTPEQTK